METAALRVRIQAAPHRSAFGWRGGGFLSQLKSWIVFGCVLFTCTALAQLPERPTDQMSDEELRAYRDARIAELRRRLTRLKPEQIEPGTLYSGVFFCTIYYTPKESGFTAARLFDVT